MELLERVVREHRRLRDVCNLEHERVAAADGAGGWCHQLAGKDRLLERGSLGLCDAVTEGGVDDDGETLRFVLGEERTHCFVELSEARQAATFGCDVGSVDNDVRDSHAATKSSKQGDELGGCSPGIVQGTAHASRTITTVTISAVLFDFGGVILSSPFEAFNRYESEHGLPNGFIRSVNSVNPHGNAWARLERGELDHESFSTEFAAESERLGHRVEGADVLPLLAGELRPAMVEALRRCAARLRTALLTNNFVGFAATPAHAPADVPATDGAWPTSTPRPAPPERTSPERTSLETSVQPSDGGVAEVFSLFDVIVESSRVGCRKPDPRFYTLALELIGIQAHEAVFLDDLGINLKPARALGMTTIKVADPVVAIAELEAIVGFPLG